MQLQCSASLTLAACLACAGVAAQPAQAPAEPPEPAAGFLSGLGLKLRPAPIDILGWVSYDMQASRGRLEPSMRSNLVTANFSGRTYVYEPWFATVSGGIALTASSSHNSGAELQGPFAVEASSSSERFVTGKLRMDLFPRSRFPFEAHFDRTDSRVDANIGSSLVFQTQNVGFSQRYRPLTGGFSVSGGFDRREQTAEGYRDAQNAFFGEFSSSWKANQLSLGMNQSDSRRMASNEQSLFRTLVARHEYNPVAALSVSSILNWSQTREKTVESSSDISVLQLSSVGLWHRPDSGLTLSGALRALMLRSGGDENAVDSIGVTLGAGYQVNQNAQLSASGSVSTTNSNGTSAQAANLSVGASYRGDTRQLRGLQYDWDASTSAGASIASSTANEERETSTNASLEFGHGLARSWPLAPQSSIAVTARQAVTANVRRTNRDLQGASPSHRALLHSLGISWSMTGDDHTAYAAITYSDSLQLGQERARFRLLNFQSSGRFEFDRNRSIVGNLTAQRVAQATTQLTEQADQTLLFTGAVPARSASASGEITYQQLRLFGMPRLRFTSRLKLAQDVLKQSGTLPTIPDRETRLWENRLDWSVGRLESQLLFRISDVDGRRREYLGFHVQRNFGN